MSVLRSRSSLTPTRVFLLSGLSGEERKDLAKKITLLGGKYFHVEDFKAHCTHVVCGKLTRSEKFLGACATGKWVLHPDYIIQSMVAKDWLDEEQFEWCDDHIARKTKAVVPLELAYASRRWRFMLGDQNGAFSGWKVAVLVGANRSKALKRLLISGGAEVFNMKIPIKNPEKIANTIGYIFVSEQNVAAVAHLLEYGVLCIRPEFIADYLIKDPPADPMDYLVQVGTNNGSGPTSSQGEAPSFLMSSQIGLPFSELSSEQDQNQPSTSQMVNGHRDHVIGDEEPVIVIPDDEPITALESSANQSQGSKTLLKSKVDVPAISFDKQTSENNQDCVQLGPAGAALNPGIQMKKSQTDNQSNRSRKKTLKTTTTSLVSLDMNIKLDSQVGKDSSPSMSKCCKNNSSKARDKSEVKRTKTNGNRNVILNREGNMKDLIASESENDLNMRNLMKSLNDNTEDVRKSERLKHSKSDPAWKGLIPRKRPSTETAESSVPSKRASLEKIDMKIETEAMRNEPVVKVENDEIAGETLSVKIEKDHLSVSVEIDPVSGDAHSDSKVFKIEPSKEVPSKTVIEEKNNGYKAEKQNIDDETLDTKFRQNEERFSERNGLKPVKLENLPSSSAMKKKKSRQDADLQSILKDIKRQKTSNCEWRPTVFALGPNTEIQNSVVIMPMTLTEIINSSLEEKLSLQTAILDDLSAKITGQYIPQPKTLHAIMVNLLLDARKDLEAYKAYAVLMKILHLHPPTSPVAQEVYRKSLCMVDSSGIDEGEMAQGADWILLKGCICNIVTESLNPDNTSSQKIRNNELLLKYLVCLIEQNLQYVMNHSNPQDYWSRPLLLRILWSPSYHVVLNSKCQQLLDLMSDVLVGLRTTVAAEQREILLKLLKTVVWLVAMATECSRWSEGGSPEGLAALQSEKTQAFIHEIARRITTADVTDSTVLQVIFSALQLPWQCVGVSQQLLNSMDDYLLADEQVRELNKITLSHIVSHYFFLLPKINMRAEQVKRCVDSPAKRQRSLIKSKKKECLVENNNSVENIAKLTNKVNKKNAKGETPLHTACIKNDANKLKQLLKMPGIDVNVKDHAGWTPLHEACNHGNIQCVQELLKFVPAKTVEHYFKKDSVVLRKVDLLAKTEEGITPLHDAVLNNRIEVCRMLLQHGGHKLLSAVTCLNYTPLHLAETEEMFSLLSSYQPLPRRVSDSQEFSFSQDSSMSVEETRTDLPPDHLYDEVTMNGEIKIFADKQGLLTYIHLVTCLLTNYVKAIDADLIREKIKEKINLARSRQKLIMGSCSQNKEGHSQSSQQSSQEGCLLSSQENEPVTPTETLRFSLSQGGESSDKENNSFGERNNIPSNRVTTKDSSETKSEPGESRINKAVTRAIKKDLIVLKYLQKYVEMFHTHIDRICAIEDKHSVELEFLELNVLVDTFSS